MKYEAGGKDGLRQGCDPGDLKAPGAAAPSIRVAGLVNSLPRKLLSSRCAFSSFFAELCRLPPKSGGATSPFWPIPLPYPEVCRPDGGGSKFSRKRLLNLAIAALDWLFLHKPARAPEGLSAGTPLSKRQWQVVELLGGLLDDSDFDFLLEPSDLGRTASKLEDQDAMLGALHRAVSSLELGSYSSFTGTGGSSKGSDRNNDSDGCLPPMLTKPFGWISGKLRDKKLIAAKPIDASRITMPPPPSFDPVPFMDVITAHAYLHPLERRLDHPRELPPPRSTIMATRSNKLDLLKLLAGTGRLGILDPGDVQNGICSGLFAVTKDLNKDRLILDGRGANVFEEPLNAWTKCLASSEKVSGIYLPPDQIILASGRDLRDFFYQFAVTRERTARNALAGALCREDLRYIFGDLPGLPSKAFVGLSTLAMGDCSACEYAQASHLGVLKVAGVFGDAELNTLTGPVPRGDVHVGVIIDDLIALERVASSWLALPEPKPLTARDVRMNLADAAYSGANLLTNPNKAFQNQPSAKFWGIELDGIRGLVRPARSRLWPLIAISMRVISLGFATVGLLKALCGSWTSIFLVRRRLLAVMDLLFAAAGGSDLDDVIRLSPELKSELWLLICLGPLAAVDLRAEPANFVTATDASSWGGAAVRAYTSPKAVLELARHSLSKGTWTKLLPPGQAWLREHDLLDASDELPEQVGFEANELALVLASSLTYQERWRKGFRQTEHINCKELRAYIIEESYVARSSANLRTVNGLDSQVALGALIKGRSASPAINQLLCASLGHYLGCGVYPSYFYFPSERNPADGPTRGKPPPLPRRALPDWWDAFSSGDFEGFDAWMASLPSRADCPDFSHLGEVVKADHRTSNSVRKLSHSSGNKRALCHEPADEDEQALSPLGVPRLQFHCRGPELDVSQPGALDLFSGSKAVSRALLRHGCPWVISYDYDHGPEQDLLKESNRAKIEDLITGGKVDAVGLAPPCNSFSAAVTPAVRSLRFPRGVPWLKGAIKQKVVDGNSHAAWCLKVICLCEAHGVTWWLEQPDTSWMWRQRGFRRFRKPASGLVWRCDFCFFGTPWRKRTKVATSTELRGLRHFCRCTAPHVVLRGRSVLHKKAWTAVAQPYPRGFAEALALAAARQVGWADKTGKLVLAACARCGHMRIGEAKNPGPRRRPLVRERDLESRPLQTAATLAFEDQLFASFLSWCSAFLSDPSLLFSLFPVFAAMALRAYGNFCFTSGKTLSGFRHTIIAVQKRLLGVKPFVSMAWELVSRWEAIEPPVHRCPIPEPMVKAMFVLAYHWGMQRWAAVTLLAFYGLARIGEVLRCRRRDLLLPMDLLDDDLLAVYLNFRESKTASRGRPKVQHTRITDCAAVRWISRVFCSLEPDDCLWPSSPGAYRYRWDLLLRCLDVPKGLGLTPGGLRGGGAVQRYRAGVSPSDLQWAMRLKHLGTLEHYLQELAAVTALTDVSAHGRNRIRTASKLYDLFAVSFRSG